MLVEEKTRDDLVVNSRLFILLLFFSTDCLPDFVNLESQSQLGAMIRGVESTNSLFCERALLAFLPSLASQLSWPTKYYGAREARGLRH